MNSIKKYVSEIFTEYGKLIELENRTWRFYVEYALPAFLAGSFLFTTHSSHAYTG